MEELLSKTQYYERAQPQKEITNEGKNTKGHYYGRGTPYILLKGHH